MRTQATLLRLALASLPLLLLLAPTSPALAQVEVRAPGPESFAKVPQTPIELWDAIDYLVRVGQPEQAVPYLQAFLKAEPSDQDLLEIRDRYGSGTVLHLDDFPQTRPFVEPLMKRMAAAGEARARDPNRLERAVAALTRTQAERDYGLDQLRQAGPYGVPYLIEALSRPELSDDDRAILVDSLGRLDRSAVPALIAALDSPDETIAAEAADALGHIGDRRAIPPLTYPAAQPEASVVKLPAQQAIARLTGRRYSAQTRSPLRVLVSEARGYLRHQVDFPSDPVELWTWQNGVGPAPQTVTKGQAEGILGMRLAQQALALSPSDHEAQVVLTALAIQKAIEAEGLGAFPDQDSTGAATAALAAGPEVLGDVVQLGLDSNLEEVAAAATSLLGRVADSDMISSSGLRHPLVQALDSPSRRVRFAAARAFVEMTPERPFAGSSRVVPVLAQFVGGGAEPKAVIIDGDENRANAVAGGLQSLGFATETADNGRDGFHIAADTADVEAIFLSPLVLGGDWKTADTLRNLRADARTKDVPVFLYGPLDIRDHLVAPLGQYQRIGFLVLPTDPGLIRNQLPRELSRMGVRPLSSQERTMYAQGAGALLARISAQPGSPFAGDFARIEPTLALALTEPGTAGAATFALAEVPDYKAQRSLADLLLDPGRPPQLRLQAADSLARSIQHFGPVLTQTQANRLSNDLGAATDPALKAALARVIGALRPKAEPIGQRLRQFSPAAPSASPAPPAPGP